MTDKTDTAQVLIRPPFALALAIVVGLGIDRLLPLPWVPADLPFGSAASFGWTLVAFAFALLVWAAVTIRVSGSNVPTNLPTTAIVDDGPYRYSRNPIYVAMFLALVGLAIALNTLWLLVTLAAFVLIIRYGVVAREEAYLERKFGDLYRGYRARVRRWL